MFKSNSERIITQLVDQLLPHTDRFGAEHQPDGSLVYNNGIMMEVSLSVEDPFIEDYEERQNTRVSTSVYMIFCSNVSVFVAEKNEPVQWFNEIPVEDWENTSNHVSCWRTDGMHWMSALYFEMCKACDPNVAPINLEADCNIGLVSLYRKVKVTMKRDDDNWKYNLLKVEEVPK